jgi:hypothetical protein
MGGLGSSSQSIPGFVSGNNGHCASEEIVKQVIPSIKSSIKYSFTPINEPSPRTTGSSSRYLQTIIEVAIPPGNAHFVKTEVNAGIQYAFLAFIMNTPLFLLSISRYNQYYDKTCHSCKHCDYYYYYYCIIFIMINNILLINYYCDHN